MAVSTGRGVGGSGFFVAGREMLLVGGVASNSFSHVICC